MSIPVYVAVGGQRDNIGDTALRRAFLDVLRTAGTLHITTGNAPESYIAGLRLHSADVVYEDRKSWRRASIRSIFRERTVWAFHTGELTMTPQIVKSYMSLAPMIVALRLSGGVGIHCGLGLRTATSSSIKEKFNARAVGTALLPCNIVTWRDAPSCERAGHGVVAPDWAFSRQNSHAGGARARDLLSVSIRHDRPGPSDEYIKAVRQFADAEDLKIVMISQTERDLGPARIYADRFGAQVLEWQSSNLSVAEDEVRSTYRRTRLAISNRLHGLVMAGIEGAIPVGLTMGDSEKLDRTLRGASIPMTGFDTIGKTSQQILDYIVGSDRSAYEIAAAFESADRKLTILAERLIQTISETPKTPKPVASQGPLGDIR